MEENEGGGRLRVCIFMSGMNGRVTAGDGHSKELVSMLHVRLSMITDALSEGLHHRRRGQGDQGRVA
jgi:hypothetical protein